MKGDDLRSIIEISGHSAADNFLPVEEDNNSFWPGLTEEELGNLSFDAAWYLRAYPDLTLPEGTGSAAAREDYLRRGAAEGRQPNEFFREDWYKQRYPDVLVEISKGRFVCGYHHYVVEGIKRNYQPTEWFDEGWYRSRYPDVALAIDAGKHLSGFDHFVVHGIKEGRIPNATFDEAWYLSVYPDVRDAVEQGVFQSSFAHYFGEGQFDLNRNPNPYFDEKWYRDHYASARQAIADGQYLNGITHYLAVGRRRGFNPNRWFDESWYRTTYPDAASAISSGTVACAFEHYIKIGRFERRKPCVDFDEDAYLQAHPEVEQHLFAKGSFPDVISGFDYFLREGFPLLGHEPEQVPGRDGARQRGDGLPFTDAQLHAFDEAGYLTLNPDVAASVAAGHVSSGLDHWKQWGYREGRFAPGLPSLLKRNVFAGALLKKQPGVTVIGLLSAASGLGAVARGVVEVFRALGLPVEEIDVTALYLQSSSALERAAVESAIADSSCLYRITFLSINPDMIPPFVACGGDRLLDNSYVISYWFWELPSFRNDWFRFFAATDEIWAASEFNRRGFAAVAPCPVRRVPALVDNLATDETVVRGSFGISDEAFVFLYIFDASSYVERKNPFALIEAFQRTFAQSEKVVLVLKTHTTENDRVALRAIQSAARQDSRIVLINERVTKEAIHSLISMADCFVSPHKSEGFGLNIAEAMWFGRPVIATDFGGSTDLVSRATGLPIQYDLEEIKTDLGPYIHGQYWASINKVALGDAMRKLVAAPGLARELGGAAAKAIREICGIDSICRLVKGIFEDLQVLQEQLPQFLTSFGATSQTTSVIHQPTGPEEILSGIRKMARQPVFSFITPVYNVAPSLLMACIDSVRAQYYPYWELCLHDDGSTNPETISYLQSLVGTDPRIRIEFSSKNEGIAAASNAAAELASGEFLCFLDNDDVITKDALFYLAAKVDAEPATDFLYCDEDKISLKGEFCDHYLKPDWSPEHLLSVMYVLHMMTVRKQLFFDLGGYRPDYTGAQDYDFALRVASANACVAHVPRILYHWRMIPGSAAEKVDAKPAGLRAARRAVEDYVRRSGRPGQVVDGMLPGTYRVRYAVTGDPRVTVVIPTDDRTAEIEGRGKINLVRNLVASIREKTTYRNYEILVVDNTRLSTATERFLRRAQVRLAHFKITTPRFNFPQKANFCLEHVNTELFVMLNDDMEIITPDWIEGLIEWAQLPEIGVVGARLLYPDDRIQHAGMVLGVNDAAAHVYHGYPADLVGYNGYPNIVRNYSALTAAVLASRKSLYKSVGGFDEAFGIDFNDVDFCLKLCAKGLRVVYTPFVSLYHFEGKTSARSAVNSNELVEFKRRWRPVLDRDPYYNINLSRDHIDFRLTSQPRLSFD